jgi:hypothetical protein
MENFTSGTSTICGLIKSDYRTPMGVFNYVELY